MIEEAGIYNGEKTMSYKQMVLGILDSYMQTKKLGHCLTPYTKTQK